MKKLTTHKGDTLLLIEISQNSNSEGLSHHLKVNGLDKNELIGTSSTLTDKDVEPFVEVNIIKNQPYIAGREEWFKNYLNTRKGCYFTKFTALESWNSFLISNGLDLSKEWVVLKLKND